MIEKQNHIIAKEEKMEVIQPKWPAPNWVRAFSTTVKGGCSLSPFASFNLALHVEDNPHHVRLNRQRLKQHYNLQHEPFWLSQTHSNKVIQGNHIACPPAGFEADGIWTNNKNQPCAVLTGDCLPLLLTDLAGSIVAAIHCGWKGMANNIIENAIFTLKENTDSELLAWLGPAIGPHVFEVGEDVKTLFVKKDPLAYLAFKPIKLQKYLADIYQLATLRLKQCGVNQVFGGQHCTFTENHLFYSYRREKQTGRMATLIWLALD